MGASLLALAKSIYCIGLLLKKQEKPDHYPPVRNSSVQVVKNDTGISVTLVGNFILPYLCTKNHKKSFIKI